MADPSSPASAHAVADTAPPPGRAGRWLPVVLLADWLWLGIVLGLLLVSAAGCERWWWALVLMYLPRWPWAMPAALLVPTTYRVARRWTWVPICCMALVAGPLMGLRWRLPWAAPPAGRQLRVMTYNVDGHPNDPAVVAEIRRSRPDIVVLQEAAEVDGPTPTPMPGYQTAGPFGGCFVASKYPLSAVEDRVLPASPAWRRYLRCSVQLPGGPATLYAVHLDTPRGGLAALKMSLLGRGSEEVAHETETRLAQARGLAADTHRVATPVLVAGDLNSPEDSLVCRALFAAGLRDAFAAAGRGYGYTYGHRLRPGVSFVRIDHILLGGGWRAARCWTGGARASDHRPVVADLVLTQPPDPPHR